MRRRCVDEEFSFCAPMMAGAVHGCLLATFFHPGAGLRCALHSTREGEGQQRRPGTTKRSSRSPWSAKDVRWRAARLNGLPFGEQGAGRGGSDVPRLARDCSCRLCVTLPAGVDPMEALLLWREY